MGAVFGIVFHGRHELVPREAILSIMRSLWRHHGPAGEHAAGVAIVREKEILIHKDGVKPVDFMDSQGYKAIMNKGTAVDKRNPLMSIIAHARRATKGTFLNNGNNQPMAINDRVVGAVEGVIANHQELMEVLTEVCNQYHSHADMAKIGETDTEVLLRLLYYYTHLRHSDNFGRVTSAKVDYMKSVQEACGHVNGSYSGAMVTATNPYLLFLFRSINPLKILIYDAPGITIFGQSDQAIRLAVQGREFGPPRMVEFPRFSGVGLNVYNNTFRVFEIIPDLGGSLDASAK
jgi:glucosamine 6-phosphate synthetase-like amidotransferase/phosphosugar isomerase protein